MFPAQLFAVDDGNGVQEKRRRDMNLRAIRKNVVDAKQEQAEQQEPGVIAQRKTEAQVAESAAREKQQRCGAIAIKKRNLGCDHTRWLGQRAAAG